MNKKKARRKPSRRSMTRTADQQISRFIRIRGVCELKVLASEIQCRGDLQCCHIVGRRYRSLRWSEANLLCGCAAHHMFFTQHPEAWFVAIEKQWPGRFAELWERAREPWDRVIPVGEGS